MYVVTFFIIDTMTITCVQLKYLPHNILTSSVNKNENTNFNIDVKKFANQHPSTGKVTITKKYSHILNVEKKSLHIA